MNSIATGITAALISGVVMYTAGAKSAQADALTPNSALVQTLDGQFVPATATALRPAAVSPGAGIVPISNRTTSNRTTTPLRRRTVNRQAAAPARAPVRDDDYRNGDYQSERSWGKTAMIVGGSAAGGAGVGGIVGGTKGALIGAAIGGGAASIYEATQRR
jgi:hypothetical protein